MPLKKQMYYTNPNFSTRIIENYYIDSNLLADLYHSDFGFTFPSKTMKFLKSKKFLKMRRNVTAF